MERAGGDLRVTSAGSAGSLSFRISHAALVRAFSTPRIGKLTPSVRVPPPAFWRIGGESRRGRNEGRLPPAQGQGLVSSDAAASPCLPLPPSLPFPPWLPPLSPVPQSPQSAPTGHAVAPQPRPSGEQESADATRTRTRTRTRASARANTHMHMHMYVHTRTQQLLLLEIR